MPLTCQVTALLVVLVTVAVKVRVPPVWTLAAAGVSDTSIGAGGGGGDGGCGAVAPLSPDAPRSSFRCYTRWVVNPTPRRDTSSPQRALNWHWAHHERGSDLQPTPSAGGGTRRRPLHCQALRSRTGISRAQADAFGHVSAAIDGASHLARGAVGAPFRRLPATELVASNPPMGDE